MSTYFVSDIHLNPNNPGTYRRFENYLKTIQPDAENLYILGDLFDYWIGDDAIDLLGHRAASHILCDLADSGTRIHVMHGNRDFLIGEEFLGAFNGTLIPDPHVIKFGEQSVLLMHGDSLCTDDIEHQRYRHIVLSPDWQREILKLPAEERLNRALDMRTQSESGIDKKSAEIMDINQSAVEEAMRKFETRILIHGHVHRTAVHNLNIDGIEARRYVLGDWDSGKDGVIRADAQGNFELYSP